MDKISTRISHRVFWHSWFPGDPATVARRTFPIPAMLRNPLILMITEDKAKSSGVGKEILAVLVQKS